MSAAPKFVLKPSLERIKPGTGAGSYPNRPNASPCATEKPVSSRRRLVKRRAKNLNTKPLCLLRICHTEVSPAESVNEGYVVVRNALSEEAVESIAVSEPPDSANAVGSVREIAHSIRVKATTPEDVQAGSASIVTALCT